MLFNCSLAAFAAKNYEYTFSKRRFVRVGDEIVYKEKKPHFPIRTLCENNATFGMLIMGTLAFLNG